MPHLDLLGSDLAVGVARAMSRAAAVAYQTQTIVETPPVLPDLDEPAKPAQPIVATVGRPPARRFELYSYGRSPALRKRRGPTDPRGRGRVVDVLA